MQINKKANRIATVRAQRTNLFVVLCDNLMIDANNVEN